MQLKSNRILAYEDFSQDLVNSLRKSIAEAIFDSEEDMEFLREESSKLLGTQSSKVFSTQQDYMDMLIYKYVDLLLAEINLDVVFDLDKKLEDIK